MISYDSYGSRNNNRRSKNRRIANELEEKIKEEKADRERVESFLSPWNNNPITTITIMNQDTFKQKLVRYLSLGLIKNKEYNKKIDY